jgi:hypothetical protein
MSGVFQNIDPPPLAARQVCTPLVRGENTLAGQWKGSEGSIFWKAPDTALYSIVCKYFVIIGKECEAKTKQSRAVLRGKECKSLQHCRLG